MHPLGYTESSPHEEGHIGALLTIGLRAGPLLSKPEGHDDGDCGRVPPG